MILIATNERDITSDYIVLELQDLGIPHYRLNTETIPHSSISFSPTDGEGGWSLATESETIRFSDFKAGYYRRPESPKISRAVIGEAEMQYCREEWQEALKAALSSLRDRWLNSPLAIFDAENKPRQLSVAIQVGFDVPETLVTNSYEKASEFLGQAPSIGKPLRTSLLALESGERAIFTTRLSGLSKTVSEAIEVAPIIFQREIPKRCDVRVTVVGQQAFAAEIHSQDNEDTLTDWRKGGHADLMHSTHELPKDIVQKCIDITHVFQLKFSAIDLVLDRFGKYWFLEMNPNGQWAWVESRTGLPISKAIANELVRISKQ